MSKYQDVYPSDPLIKSTSFDEKLATDLLTLEYFEAEASKMPKKAFDQHYILINLNPVPHRVENFREDEHLDFTFNENELFITPAGIKSGWRWHSKSKVIVITLEPQKFNDFAINEVGVLLTDKQLSNIKQFKDEDLTNAARNILEALESKKLGFEVMFESLARVFLIKLIQKYGDQGIHEYNTQGGLSSQQYKNVLDFIKGKYGQSITLEDLSSEASISPNHFSKLFKSTIGSSPMQFVMSYRIEQAKKLISNSELSLVEIAQKCGFSDQAHLSRSFKSKFGKSPKSFR